MYNDTITLFNRVRTAQGDTWRATVLTNVNLVLDKAAVIETYGESSQDNAVLNVRLYNTGGTLWIMSDGVSFVYVPPKEYQRLEDKTGYLTFTPGNGFDFFWRGIWTGGSVIADENYGDMSFYDWMTVNYDHVYAVTSVSELSVIPHLEITAR